MQNIFCSAYFNLFTKFIFSLNFRELVLSFDYVVTTRKASPIIFVRKQSNSIAMAAMFAIFFNNFIFC